jgi:predicted ATPase
VADTDALAEKWAKELARVSVDQLRDLVIIDKRTDTPVSHRDIGIGISQVLPVLVSAYASIGKIVAIEQPEIHLHPALQAELGDVFIESALGQRRNTFILETHSEHLILRLMRRMRDTCEGRLPTGLPPVRPEDVAILYVQPRDAAAVVRVLELDEEGQLLDPWPGGFFEEGFRERFA